MKKLIGGFSTINPVVIEEPLDANLKYKSDPKLRDVKKYYTEYTFKIDKTILGDVTGNIKFTQVDGIETKVQPGKNTYYF